MRVFSDWSTATFILDAKYYKFGIVPHDKDYLKEAMKFLPGSDSVTKQMAYAEYVEQHPSKFGKGPIYNAFILPYCAEGFVDSKVNNAPFKMNRAGYIYGDWKALNRPYHKIVCILLDMKSVMRNYASSKNAQEALAKMIREGAK